MCVINHNVERGILMRSILLSITFISALFFLGISVGADELPKTFDPQRDAGKDLSLAIKMASESEKNILLDVGGSWCIWCRIMENWLKQNTNVESYLHANYILLKINFSPENENKEFLSQFPKVPAYPHLFVLSSEGEFLHSQNTGSLENGKSYDQEKFLIFLKEWSPKK